MEYINKDEINIPNLITFQEWNTLKQYGKLTDGYRGFVPEDLDQIVVFYDQDLNYLDYLARREIEELWPSYVLVPRFFWEEHQERIPQEFLPGLRIPDRQGIYNNWAREIRFRREARYLNEEYLFDCNLVPREEQVPALEFLAQEFKERGNLRGILQAPPGVGKTAMSIKTAHGARTQTIIIVPNEVLQDQWVDAIEQFTNLKKENLAIIQGSDLQKINKELNGKSIAIVKIQSLYSQIKNNPIHKIMDTYRFFDLVVFDEAHTSAGATGYAKTSSLFWTNNFLGLTATPYRQDLNAYMLRVAIGEVIHKIEHNNLTPDIEIHKIYTEFSQQEINKLKFALSEYTMFLGVFGAMMKGKNPYFEYLADVVAWNFKHGHNIVILFPTIALMEKLQKYINQRHPDIIEKVLLLKGKTKQDSLELVKEERKVIMQEYKLFREEQDQRVKDKEIKRKEYLVIVKDRRKEIDEHLSYLKEHALDLYKQRVKEANIIISNYNLLSAGFDKSELSNIIFGGAPRIGKISVIQSIGRITRKHADKKHPLVQYFIPSTFLDFQESTGVILNRNIKIQYPDAKFKYVGFQ